MSDSSESETYHSFAVRIRPATPADAEPLAPLLAQEAQLQEQLGGYALTPDFDWAAWL